MRWPARAVAFTGIALLSAVLVGPDGQLATFQAMMQTTRGDCDVKRVLWSESFDGSVQHDLRSLLGERGVLDSATSSLAHVPDD